MNLRVQDTQLTSIGNAIRSKGETSGQLTFPDGFVTGINNLHQLKMTSDTFYLNAGNSSSYMQTGAFYKLKTLTNLYSQLLTNTNVSSGTIQINKVSLPGTGNDIICVMRIYGTNNITFYAQNTSQGTTQLGANQDILIEYTVTYYT